MNRTAQSVTFNAQQAYSQDNYNRAAEWGLATINTPGRWTTSINYQLPFGRGQKFLSNGSACWIMSSVAGP